MKVSDLPSRENLFPSTETFATVGRISRINCDCARMESSTAVTEAEIHRLLKTDAKLKPDRRGRCALEQGLRSIVIAADSMQCCYQASTNNAIRLAVIIDNALCVPRETFHKDTDIART